MEGVRVWVGVGVRVGVSVLVGITVEVGVLVKVGVCVGVDEEVVEGITGGFSLGMVVGSAAGEVQADSSMVRMMISLARAGRRFMALMQAPS
jgi:hypothetical protein